MRGPETEQAHQRRLQENFYDKYLRGQGIDVGFQGSLPKAEPVVPYAQGIDLGHADYNGYELPVPPESQDFIYCSHCLEHVSDYKRILRAWMTALRVGGHLVITVPHQFLYEKKLTLPSRWNCGHLRFYTPASLLREVEETFEPNSYRVIRLKDCDERFDYSIPPDRHSGGAYEIELIVQKIKPPEWKLAP